MDMSRFLPGADEKPLDQIPQDGGFCGIFRTIGCIGDSLSSGEFEHADEAGKKHYYDRFEYSWGQYLARQIGSKVYNFSRGGMTAKEYIESFAESNLFWANDKLCQAYIIALGVNDLFGRKQTLGTVNDTVENDTFAGYYAEIIKRLKKMQPEARFFLMTMPRSGNAEQDALKEKHAELLYQFAEMFSNTYVMDFTKYAPVYDEEFKQSFYLEGHMNPMGYILTARMVASYIDYIIRHNMQDFSALGLMGII